MNIRCGSCAGRHGSAAEVKECYREVAEGVEAQADAFEAEEIAERTFEE
jgi:hypothetical protein